MARKKVYRTNKGKMIDMEAMRAANEQATAAGNMRVNAKGDEIKGGKVVKTAKERVAPYYKAKTQTARTSIKPPIKKKDAQINTPVAEELPPEVAEEPPVVKLREREDGSTYNEIMYSDGSMETEEVSPAPKKKKAKKKTKKKTQKKDTDEN